MTHPIAKVELPGGEFEAMHKLNPAGLKNWASGVFERREARLAGRGPVPGQASNNVFVAHQLDAVGTRPSKKIKNLHFSEHTSAEHQAHVESLLAGRKLKRPITVHAVPGVGREFMGGGLVVSRPKRMNAHLMLAGDVLNEKSDYAARLVHHEFTHANRTGIGQLNAGGRLGGMSGPSQAGMREEARADAVSARYSSAPSTYEQRETMPGYTPPAGHWEAYQGMRDKLSQVGKSAMISAFGISHGPDSYIAKAEDRQERYYRRQANALGAMGGGSALLAGIAGSIGVAEHKGKDPMGFTRKRSWAARGMSQAQKTTELNRVAREHGKQVLGAGAVAAGAGLLSAGYRHKQHQRQAELAKADSKRSRALDVGTIGLGTGAVGGSAMLYRGYGHHGKVAGQRALHAHRILRDEPHADPRKLAYARDMRKVGARVWALKKPGSYAVAGGLGGIGAATAIGATHHAFGWRKNQEPVTKADDEQRQKYYGRQAATLGTVGGGIATIGGVSGLVARAERKGKDPMGWTMPADWRHKDIGMKNKETVLRDAAKVHVRQAKGGIGFGAATLGLAGAYKLKQHNLAHQRQLTQAQVAKADTQTKGSRRTDAALAAGTVGAGFGMMPVAGRMYGAYAKAVRDWGKSGMAQHHVIQAHKAGEIDVPKRMLQHAHEIRANALRMGALKGPGAAAALGLSALGGTAAVSAAHQSFINRKRGQGQ